MNGAIITRSETARIAVSSTAAKIALFGATLLGGMLFDFVMIPEFRKAFDLPFLPIVFFGSLAFACLQVWGVVICTIFFATLWKIVEDTERMSEWFLLSFLGAALLPSAFTNPVMGILGALILGGCALKLWKRRFSQRWD